MRRWPLRRWSGAVTARAARRTGERTGERADATGTGRCQGGRCAERSRPANRHPATSEGHRLRAEASRILVDAALAAGTAVYVQPTVTFVYPAEGPVSEATPIAEAAPILRSALAAERQTARFASAGRRGVVLRLGLLDGPGTGHDEPASGFGASLHVADAGRALLAALTVPSGIYNVCRDGERVSNRKFSSVAGWRPRR
jgi:nucleoside-diphosphate-sugar epimerase